ncbi:MetQ/NlpA family ABC transporter substrate-binding protein [Luteipulveratus sp. YIM 133132]|uniref:MetQ/NlpA family ABC transporter substrate-binding protein n=1 Tax=Luteipulveratus flavus TaxID=3031728 RepID=UPI0023AEBF19|nr:MetQ/NlpA family ABC transporter substrate-binding protein [Luteipulveratus sp. YIM 133132]MDE9365128.1 MetQ/NlpA family ABC transporter substrate-binding protein [Luteipulveratus sp. YIM 133132]
MSETPGTPPTEQTAPALPDKPGRGRGALIGGVAAGVVVLVAAGFAIKAVASDDDGSGAAGTKTVTIGTTEASAPYWKPLKDLAAKEGITITVVNFGDYTQANPALAQKQTDLNLFQHLQFLATYDVEAKQDLTPIGSTVVVPLGLYSKKHTALAQIPQGGKVAIPNDPTNQARALLVLQQAGLLKLKGGGNTLSTPKDVEASASKVTVAPVDAAQTVASLPSVDASVVNNNFALDAKLDPSKALFNDDPKRPEAEPYINAFVARAADKDNPTYLKIARLYHDPSVVKQVEAYSKGTAVIVDKPQADLQKVLDRLKADAKK